MHIYYYRITLHNSGGSHCEVLKHCIKSKKAFLLASNVTSTDNATSGNITASNATTENGTSIADNTNHTTTEPNESSGTTPVMPVTDEPTKKPTEKRSTEIINILIGNRRRRASRVSKMLLTLNIYYSAIVYLVSHM